MPELAPVILIVDPNPQTSEILRQAVTSEFNAYVAELNGTSSLLDAVLEVIPDVIVLEVHAFTDLERIRQVRTVPPMKQVPIMAMIAWGQDIDCGQCREAGCTACIEKPFELRGLIERLKEFIPEPATQTHSRGSA
jgi:CheY-like chemotaxis protein